MRQKLLKSKYLIPLRYVLFFILTFLAFLYITFPVESFKERIIYEVETGTPFKADIESLDVFPLFNFKIRNMKLYKSKKPALNIDELNVSPSISYLFSDKLGVPFRARLFGGETAGTLTYNSKTKRVEKVEAEIVGVDVKTITSVIPADRGKKGPSIQGLLKGNFSVELNPRAQGRFAFSVKGLGIKDLRVRGFLLPEFSNVESSFRGQIEDEKTKIEELRFEGDDIDLLLSGTAPLLWNIKRGGKIDLGLRLQLRGTKLAAFKSILASYLAPQADGMLGGKIAGTLHNPRLVKESANLGRF